jgi:hypothetical protein
MFGWVARENGVYRSGFMLAGAVVVVGTPLFVSVRARRCVAPVEVAATAKDEAVEVAVAAQELACKQHVELVAVYLDEALTPKMRARSEEHLAGCDGCTTYPRQTPQIIAGLRALSTAPEKVEDPSYRFLDVARESPRSDAVYLQQRQAKVADLGE